MNKPAPEIRTEEELPKENTPSVLPRLPRPAERKKRWGDRREGRLLHNLYAMNKFMPYIMPERSDGCNTYADEFDVTETDAFCKQMIAQGLENFSFLHVMLAAYVRTLSQKPAINRFIAGQRIYARNNIEIVMVIKKEMTSESPDTCIKVVFEPDDTVGEVYEKFDRAVEAVKATQALDSDFDKTANRLASLPRFVLRGIIRLLNWLDYHGCLPEAILRVSPFHGSMIITSMGSLGIKPIYHHIYNFGTLPVFISYGVTPIWGLWKMSETILKIEDLQVHYGGIEAVKGISFDVQEGQIVTLIGSNGAGKSSTLRTISGLVKPSSGKITFRGEDITGKDPTQIVTQGVTLVPEGRRIFPDMTVLENLKIGAYLRKDDLSEDLEWVYSLFPRLKERSWQAGGTLSGGEQQMLAVGRALMSRPKLLMMDEPSLGLAPLVVRDIFSIIQEINKQGVTILLIEQNANMALKIADVGYVLETGRITLTGSGEELLTNDAVRAAYLGA